MLPALSWFDACQHINLCHYKGERIQDFCHHDRIYGSAQQFSFPFSIYPKLYINILFRYIINIVKNMFFFPFHITYLTRFHERSHEIIINKLQLREIIVTNIQYITTNTRRTILIVFWLTCKDHSKVSF